MTQIPDLSAIRQQIKELEARTRHMEPTKAEWTDWLTEVTSYLNEFLVDTREGPAYRQPEPGRSQEDYGFSLGTKGESLTIALDEMREWVDYSGLNPASGGHLAYIPGGGVLPSALGDLLAAVTNRYAGVAFANPGAVALEHFLIRWMARLFGFPESTGGNLSSGGSIANLIAITTARDAKGVRPVDYERLVIYGSARMHHCIQKALRIAGLGFSPLREIALDERQRMIPDDLQRQINVDREAGLLPFLIIGSAGTTDTGSIDPLDALADIADQENLWFHIDAAYGGFFYLLPEVKPRLKGISRAHSLVVDPHKGLFLPYGTGAVLIRDIHLLHASQYYQANYMQDAAQSDQGWSPADLSPELTKHFRGLRMYMALKLFGVQTFEYALAEKIALCQYFHHAVQELGFDVGPFPELSVTHFRFIPAGRDLNAVNRWIMDRVHEDGRVFLSSTTLDGQIWIRLAVLSFRSKFRHIEQTLQMLKDIVAKLPEND